MAPKTSLQRRPRSPQQEPIDNYLLDDDDFGGDPFASPGPESPRTRPKDSSGLGIEEEVTVAKKARVPRVKLDESRLLSENGIPKLRRKTKDLKLKGKGHEFSDAARLLSFYQVWLDDLFPKAKFLDALAMVEKAGHKTTMHKQRMDWINEGKPRPADDMTYEEDDAPAETGPTRIAPIFEKTSSARPTTPTADDLFGDDDIYSATPGARRLGTVPVTAPPRGVSGEPDEDDLDAMMAEADAHAQERNHATAPTSIFGGGGGTTATAAQSGPPEEDELDAMMAEAEAESEQRPSVARQGSGDGGVKGNRSIFGSGPSAKAPPAAAGDDPDDLDALMAEAEAEVQPKPAAIGSGTQQKKPEAAMDRFADDEEAMAEMDGLW